MSQLKLYGMKAAYDEIITTAVKPAPTDRDALRISCAASTS